MFMNHLALKGQAPASVKSVYLVTVIGEELREAISNEDMLTKPRAKGEPHDELDRTLVRLDAYFDNMSDEGTNMNVLMELKQYPNETVNNFSLASSHEHGSVASAKTTKWSARSLLGA
jgi:hypothetical protein